MDKIEINGLGDFYWPKQDTKCASHLKDRWVDAIVPLKYVKDFGVCVQAGGNVGVWPKYLATKFKTVYTFEPNQENFKFLCMNVPEYNVIKINAALGNRNQLISTTLPDHEVDNIGAYQVEAGGIVPTFKIDQLGLKSCDIIILDIEGSELDAIYGAEKTIELFSPVIHLEDKGLSEKYGHGKGQVVRNLVERFGYKVTETIARDFILCK